MFGKKKSEGLKSKVKDIPGCVLACLVAELKTNPDLVGDWKAAVQQRQGERDTFDIKIFDEQEAKKRRIKVSDMTSLEEHPELILFEGWYCDWPIRVELKKSVRGEETK